MKILHVTHSVNPEGGGVIEGIRQLSAALIELGASVDVLSLDTPGSPGVVDFPLSLFPLGTGQPGYGYAPQVLPWLIEHGPGYDLILINGLWQYSGLAVWRAAQKVKLHYAVFPHGMLDPWFRRHYPLKHLKKWLYWPWAEYRILRDADAVLFTTEEERLQARQSFWLYRCHEKVLGYGIASPPPDATRQIALFIEKFPQLSGKCLVLFLGRLHEKKGCDLLLHAFAETLREHPSANLHLVMAGPGAEPNIQHLESLSRQLDLKTNITWTGMISGDLKWGAFRSADAFILPSHQENFGVSVAEALACGIPVLISDKVNIWREVLAHQAGLVEPDDQPGTTRLLRRWLALDSSTRATMRRQAFQCYATRYNVTAVAQNLLEFFSK